jgi:hypothetical protein
MHFVLLDDKEVEETPLRASLSVHPNSKVSVKCVDGVERAIYIYLADCSMRAHPEFEGSVQIRHADNSTTIERVDAAVSAAVEGRADDTIVNQRRLIAGARTFSASIRGDSALTAKVAKSDVPDLPDLKDWTQMNWAVVHATEVWSNKTFEYGLKWALIGWAKPLE